MHVEQLASDTHNDLKWFPDLRAAISEICQVLKVKYTFPEGFISFRWLSAYDAALDLNRLLDALIIFYFSFLDKLDKNVLLHQVIRIYKKHNTSKKSKDHIRGIQALLSSKNLTDAGKHERSGLPKNCSMT